MTVPHAADPDPDPDPEVEPEPAATEVEERSDTERAAADFGGE